MIIIRLFINAAALLALSSFIPGLHVDGVYTAIIAAVILGILNVLIRPIVLMLTLPLTVLTFGLFALVINGLFFWFVASFVDGFSVAGFWPAFFGALGMSVVSWLTHNLLRMR